MSKIYLASASPRRAELLSQIAVNFEVIRTEVDETIRSNENVADYVVRLALKKAAAGHKLALKKDMPVLGSDTAVYAEGQILGKPSSFEDALQMLTLLSGKTHQVLTAVALVNEKGSQHITQTTDVTMGVITKDEIKAYWQTNEPLGKAGSYAIQGMAAVFITKISGSYSGVMGLPLFETARLLSDFKSLNKLN